MDNSTRSTTLLPGFKTFDPNNHPGNELKFFEQWLRRFENRYVIVTDIATDATAADKAQDKKQWLLNYVTDNVLGSFEALYTTADLFKQATYTDVVDKYKQQLKPIQTATLLRHRFHQLSQNDDDSFDNFVNRVKKEVTYCNYSCNEDRL